MDEAPATGTCVGGLKVGTLYLGVEAVEVLVASLHDLALGGAARVRAWPCRPNSVAKMCQRVMRRQE